MKKLLFLLSIAAGFFACQKVDHYQITGHVSGLDSGLVKLSKRVEGKFVTLDSCDFTGSSFNLEGSVPMPEYVYLSIDGKRGYTTFFVENSVIEIKLHADSLNQAVITGSATQDEYESYEGMFESFNDLLMELGKKYQVADSLQDEKMIAEIMKEYEEVSAQRGNLSKQYVKDHPASLVSVHILRYELMYEMEWEELEEITNSLDQSLAETDYVKFLKDRVGKLKIVAIGQPAPDFTQNDSTGNPVTLSGLVKDSRLLLVDFWASWCGPCRRENPNIVAVYNDYHEKGFNILGVSLDTDRDRWLEAIKNDELTWAHVSDLKGWQNVVGVQYAVQSIPHSVLINSEGIIVAKNLRSEKLREEVAALLTE